MLRSTRRRVCAVAATSWRHTRVAVARIVRTRCLRVAGSWVVPTRSRIPAAAAAIPRRRVLLLLRRRNRLRGSVRGLRSPHVWGRPAVLLLATAHLACDASAAGNEHHAADHRARDGGHVAIDRAAASLRRERRRVQPRAVTQRIARHTLRAVLDVVQRRVAVERVGEARQLVAYAAARADRLQLAIRQVEIGAAGALLPQVAQRVVQVAGRRDVRRQELHARDAQQQLHARRGILVVHRVGCRYDDLARSGVGEGVGPHGRLAERARRQQLVVLDHLRAQVAVVRHGRPQPVVLARDRLHVVVIGAVAKRVGEDEGSRAAVLGRVALCDDLEGVVEDVRVLRRDVTVRHEQNGRHARREDLVLLGLVVRVERSVEGHLKVGAALRRQVVDELEDVARPRRVLVQVGGRRLHEARRREPAHRVLGAGERDDGDKVVDRQRLQHALRGVARDAGAVHQRHAAAHVEHDDHVLGARRCAHVPRAVPRVVLFALVAAHGPGLVRVRAVHAVGRAVVLPEHRRNLFAVLDEGLVQALQRTHVLLHVLVVLVGARRQMNATARVADAAPRPGIATVRRAMERRARALVREVIVDDAHIVAAAAAAPHGAVAAVQEPALCVCGDVLHQLLALVQQLLHLGRHRVLTIDGRRRRHQPQRRCHAKRPPRHGHGQVGATPPDSRS
mmetsp:Transcript_20691/g.73080  ORF Transcript_20691/g.73080 Transcript_20691/m.73080 type:complete len:676 (-) Transcript_20691:95-2122(-)